MIKHLEIWIIELIYTRQSLLNLRNFRYLAVLDYWTNRRIKCLNINKKFRSKRGNRKKTDMEQNLLTDPGTMNSGIHWEVLKQIPASIHYTHLTDTYPPYSM